jgi:hypothetical protein
MMAWGFTFATPPGSALGDGEIRLDAPTVAQATRLYLDNLDHDGQWIRPMIAAYPAGTLLFLEGIGGAYLACRLLQAPIPQIGYLELPVTILSSSPDGVPPGAVQVAFVRAGRPLGARDAATDPPLITLADAKLQLNVTDDLHDDIITSKLTAASATIRDYLKAQNDPTWTDTTVPPWIAESVRLLLGHLYEHRGDEFGPAQDNDDRVWTAIGNLCRRTRDPALA